MTNTPAKVATFVVNLDRAVIRRETMERELAGAGINGEFLPAVDAAEVGEAALLARFDDFGPWGIVPVTNMAITWSHQNIWQEFLATAADIALVLEDDVYIAPELGEWLEDLSWWPADADIVKLEVWPDTRMVHILSRRASEFRGRSIARLYSRHPGAAGYLVTRQHAQRMLRVDRINLSTDSFIFDPYVSGVAREASIYQVSPGLVGQGNDPGHEQTVRTHKKAANKRDLRRQAWLRGWAQLRNLPRHIWQLITGQARLARLTVSLTPVGST